MECMESNGAECVREFIADGCRGKVFPLKHIPQWNLDWLSEPFVYIPPDQEEDE